MVLIGALRDPRPAYAASDIVLGMGGSALRGLSFAKPLVMIGERGFARLFTPETVPEFLQNGMFGIGQGDAEYGFASVIDHQRSFTVRRYRQITGRQKVG